MKLVAVSAVRSALRFDDMSNLNSAIDAALTSATVSLAEALRNLPSFTRETAVTDRFFVRPGSVIELGSNAYPRFRTRLALRRGFLTAAPVVTYGITPAEIVSGPTTVAAEDTIVDLDKGEVILEGPDVRGQYVNVTCTRGFAADADDPYVFAETGVPDWLRRLCIDLATAKLFETNPELTPENVTREPKDLRKNALAAASARTRYFPSALHPM